MYFYKHFVESNLKVMKKYLINILALVLSILMCNGVFAAGGINTGGGTVPFGSKGAYQYGIVPTNLPTGGTYGGSNDAASAYNAWKSTYVASCTDGSYRVLFDDNYSTVSEGIAYGMLLSVYADDKDLFDGLWKYYKNNRNGNGVMNWKIGGCSGASGQNGATDAELDAAMALIIASIQWPKGSYGDDAVSLIKKIKTYEMSSDGHTLNGDAWGSANSCRNPSYFAPAYYKEFANVDASNASFWSGSAISASNTVLKANRNSTSGLVSNWCDASGTENSCGNTGSGANGYGADACRNPWRMAVDYLWHGSSCSSAASDINAKLSAFVKDHESNVTKGPFSNRNVSNPDGGAYSNGSYSTFALPVMTGSNQTSLNKCYTAVKNLGDYDVYFNTTIRCITMFVLTGNFWSPDAAGAVYPPKVLSAKTDEDGNIILVTSKELSGSASASNFTVYYDGTLQSVVSSVSTSGTNVIVNVSKSATPGQVIQISYNGSGNIASKSDGVKMEAFTKQSVVSMVAGSQVIIDEVSDGNEFNNLGGIWFSYNDADDGNGAPSKVSVIEPSSSSSTPFAIDGSVNGPDGKPYCISARFKLGSGTKNGEYSSYVGIGTYMHKDNDNGVVDWSKNTGVTFMYKGPKCKMNFVMQKNVEWNIHYYEVPSCPNWTEIQILFTDLIQAAGWGIICDFDPSQVVKLQWQFTTDFSETPKNMSSWAYAYIDDVKLMTNDANAIKPLTALAISLVSEDDLAKDKLASNANPEKMVIASGAKGDTLYLETTPTPSNATYPVVLWESSDETVATVDYKGRVLGVGYGKATITARSKMHQSIYTTFDVTVPAPAVKPTAIAFDKTSYEITVGESIYIIPSFTPSNATETGLSWETSDNTKAIVASDGKVTAIDPGTVTITATSTSVSSVKKTVTVTVKKCLVIGVAVEEFEVSLELGESKAVATSVLPAAVSQEVTASSSDESIATVAVSGNTVTISSVGIGDATITVKSKEDPTMSATIAVTVTGVAITSVEISGLEDEIFIGATTTLTAAVSPNTATQTVDWSSSNESIATVTGGVVRGIAEGSVTITATSTEDVTKSDTYIIKVNPVKVTGITVTPASKSLAVAGTVQLSATVEPSTATNKTYIWSSSDETIATVSNDGLVTAVKIGSCTIKATAQDGSNVVGECAITVETTKVTSITVLPATATLKVADTQTLTASVLPNDATDKSYVWSSSDEAIATVDATGKVTAVAKGSCSIKATAQDGSAVVGECAVTVEDVMPTKITMATSLGFSVGDAAQTLTPTFDPANTTDQTVAWTTSDATVATVTNGVVTPVGVGSCTITATSNADNTIKAECAVSVVANTVSVTGVSFDESAITIYYGKTAELSAVVEPADATNKAVTWVSSDPTTVSIDANGVVTGNKIGNATITVTTVDGNKTATCTVSVEHIEMDEITVTPDELSLTMSSAATQLIASYLPEDATNTTIVWSIDEEESQDVVTVSATGVVTPIGLGETYVVASNEAGDVYSSCRVVVSAIEITSISLDKETLTFTMGDAAQELVPTIEPSNASVQTVAWSTDKASVATVANGVVTPVGVGTCTITATAGSKTATCSVTVSPKAVTGVSLDKETLEIGVGSSGALSATVSPADATDQSVSWSSSNESVATVADGIVSGVAAGNATITVTTTDGNKTATCAVTVKANTIAVTGVTISPADSKSVALNESLTFTATVAPSTATTKDVTWSSSDESVATITNGVVTLKKAGTTTITVTTVDGDFTASCDLTVTDVLATTIIIDNALSLTVGESKSLSLTILPADAAQTATWSSSNELVATVDATGKVTAIAQGSAEITATTTDGTDLTSDPCKVTVSNISVTAVNLDVTSKVIRLSNPTATLIASVVPSNATIKDINWSSSKEAIATVADGVVTALSVGTTTITAASAEDAYTKATCAVEVVDASALSAELATANASYSAAVEGTNVGQYKSGSKSTFMNGISAAQAVFDNADATQTDLDAALADLKDAEKVFAKALISNETLIFNAELKQENMTQMATYWFSFNDATASEDPTKCGSSVVTPLATEENPFTMATPGYNGTGKSAMIQYTLEGKKALGYNPFVGMGMNFDKTEGVPFDMTGSTGISFYIKSDSKVYFEVEMTTITDAGDYYTYLGPYADWTLVELNWSDLEQYNWAVSQDWDLTQLTKCQWKVQEPDGETGKLYVDEVKILGVALNLPEIIDYDELYTAIADAQTVLEDAVIGTKDGNYPQKAKTALEGAITVAEGVIDNAKTQAIADKAVTTLRAAIETFENSQIVVDRSALQAKIETAQDYYLNSQEGYQEGMYLIGSKATLMTAIDAAQVVLETADVDQSTIDKATTKLQTAIETFLNSKFDPSSINRNALETALDEANSLYADAVEGAGNGQYQTGSKAVFYSAIADAQEAYDNTSVSQEQIDQATTMLNSAISAFKNAMITVDKTKLNTSITTANSLYATAVEGVLKGNYPVGAKAILMDAINAAQSVYGGAGSSQAEVNQATTTLNAAIETFKASVITVDKSNLSFTLQKANTSLLKAEGNTGDGSGQYPNYAVTEFVGKITEAQDVYDNATNQIVVNDAVTALEKAIKEFEASKNPEEANLSDLIILIAEADELIAKSVNPGNYLLEYLELATCASNARAEVSKTTHTQENVNTQCQRLSAAIDAFKAVASFETAIDDVDVAQLIMYPNPCQNELNIVAGKVIKKIVITSVSGSTKLVLNVDSESVQVDVTSIKAGTYNAIIEYEDGTKEAQSFVKH